MGGNQLVEATPVDPRWHELDDVDTIARILGEILRHQASSRSPSRRGKQAAPSEEDFWRFMDRLAVLDKWSTQQFPVELRALAGESATTTEIAQRVGTGRTRCWELLTGRTTPSREDLEMAARAFGRNPMHFVEYRADVLSTMVRDWMVKHPGRSEVLVNRLGLVPSG